MAHVVSRIFGVLRSPVGLVATVAVASLTFSLSAQAVHVVVMQPAPPPSSPMNTTPPPQASVTPIYTVGTVTPPNAPPPN
jgi:hypothetical protein